MSHIFKIKRDLVSSRVKEARQASHYLYLSCHILSSARENIFNSMLEMVRLKRLAKLVCFFFGNSSVSLYSAAYIKISADAKSIVYPLFHSFATTTKISTMWAACCVQVIINIPSSE